MPHITRPDGDNLEKFLNDCLSGIVFEDDCQIAWMVRSKSITDDFEGSTTVFVKQLPNEYPKYDELLEDIRKNITICWNPEVS